MCFDYSSEFKYENPSVFRGAKFRSAESNGYAAALHKHTGEFLPKIGSATVKFDCIELSELNIKVFFFCRVFEHSSHRIIPIFRAKY